MNTKVTRAFEKSELDYIPEDFDSRLEEKKEIKQELKDGIELKKAKKIASFIKHGFDVLENSETGEIWYVEEGKIYKDKEYGEEDSVVADIMQEPKEEKE